MRRGVGKKHPARRMARAFGYAALAGLALVLLCIPLGMLMSTVEGGTEHPVFVVPLFLGVILTCAGWIMWGSWSATLDQYSEPLSTTAKLTLASSITIVLGVLFLMGAGVPILMYPESDPPDRLLPVVIVIGGLGVLLVAGTIVAAAVYGGIALGGARWWWVGALLSAALIAIGVGVAFGNVLLTVASAAGLVVACVGYRQALVAGVKKRRPDAIEAQGQRGRTG